MTDRNPSQPPGTTPGRGRRTDKASAAGPDADLSADGSSDVDSTDLGGDNVPPAAVAAPKPVGPRRERYLVAHLGPPPGQLNPLGATVGGAAIRPEALIAHLQADPSVTVHRVISPTAHTEQAPLGTFGAGPGASMSATPAFPHVAVVEMDPDRAQMFAAGPMMHVEPDLPLRYNSPDPGTMMTFADPGVVPLGDDNTIVFSVLGSDGKALEGAEVYLMNDAFPVRGVTGADGSVILNAPASALTALRGLYVKPAFDYWAIWLANPELSLEAPNLVTCPSFAETFPGFPERQLDGWARRAMRFDSLPPTFRGHGVKVAVIDSGVAVEHPDLKGRFLSGRDCTEHNDTGWRVDTVGHGSHTGGIVGASDNGFGIVGVVPEAEMHSCKIFPGGRFSDLIEALDYCIANKIDVVNLSLGSPQASELIARKIEHARQAGVACIVAAGNSAGPVAFPASMRTVLAVAAIGKTGEYPPESYHATQVYGNITPEGYFSAAFTCYGPEVDVCAPGVAIVSSVPPTNYAAWDGTSFAAPNVTGLAALLLAHHADFRDRYAARDANRVDRLFELIKSSCRPLQLGDPGRSGAGLPDAVAALGLVGPVTMTPPTHPLLANLWAAMAHAGLIPTVVPTIGPASMPAAAAATMLAAAESAALSARIGGAGATTGAGLAPMSAGPVAGGPMPAGPMAGGTQFGVPPQWAGQPPWGGVIWGVPAWGMAVGVPAWAGPTTAPAWAGPTGIPPTGLPTPGLPTPGFPAPGFPAPGVQAFGAPLAGTTTPASAPGVPAFGAPLAGTTTPTPTGVPTFGAPLTGTTTPTPTAVPVDPAKPATAPGTANGADQPGTPAGTAPSGKAGSQPATQPHSPQPSNQPSAQNGAQAGAAKPAATPGTPAKPGTSLTATSSDALAPLRAAMLAAGLLPQPPQPSA